MDTFAGRLRKLIDSKGVTPYEVSKETGVPESSLSRYLTKGAKPTKDNREKIAKYFHVTSDYLLTGKEEFKLSRENIRLDDDLINRKEEFRAIIFYLNENFDSLINDEVFKLFVDRIKSEGRTEARLELAKEYKDKTESNIGAIKDKLSPRVKKED